MNAVAILWHDTMLKSAFWSQRWSVCALEDPWLQTSKFTALARLPGQLGLGLILGLLALLNTARVKKVQVMSISVLTYPRPARALQVLPSTASPRRSAHSTPARKLLKGAETGQELSRDMQVQTQAQKVVFQVSGCYFPKAQE